MALNRSDREQLLQKVERLVSEKFYDATFNGKDWPKIVAGHRQKILDADTVEAFESAIATMLSELGSTALGLLGSHTKVAPRNSVNASFRNVNTEAGARWVFQDVLPGGAAAQAGIRSGDTLISVGDTQVLPPNKPAFMMSSVVPVVVSRGLDRKILNLQVCTPSPKYKENPYTEPESIQASTPVNGVGRVKISMFPGKIGIDFANRVSQTFESKLNGLNRPVVDLRGNPGGGVGGLRVMSYFTPTKLPVGYSLDRPTAERGYDKNSLPRFDRIPSSKLGIPLLAFKYAAKKSVVLVTEGLGAKPFHGKIVLLVNEHSTGAAEMVAHFAQENGLATIVGTKTPGHLVAREAFDVCGGYKLMVPIGAYMSWAGTRIEGRGIEPDVPVDWSYNDALAGVDTQLNKGIEVAQSL
jgi:carboxyl-terminal processing protease